MPIGVLEFPWADLTVADGPRGRRAADDTIVRLVPTGEGKRIRLEGKPGALAAGSGRCSARTACRALRHRGRPRVETGTPTDLVRRGSAWRQDDPATVGQTASPFLLDLRTGERTPLAESLAGGFNYVASPTAEVAYGTCLGEDAPPTT
jgi:hypothetical protein